MDYIIGGIIFIVVIFIIAIVMMVRGKYACIVKLREEDGRTIMAERGKNVRDAVNRMMYRLDVQYADAKTFARKEKIINYMETLLCSYSKYLKGRECQGYNSRVESYKAECAEMQTKALNQKIFAKEQRSLMSDSLRYDVMKRDGFRCVLCGATVADGAKLHVDHIMSIAKGGKTEMSNLRTLCDRCNLGKGVKLEKE